MELYLPEIPDFVFENEEFQEKESLYLQPGTSIPILDTFKDGSPKITYPETGGILRHFRGYAYPTKGFPTPTIGYAVDTAKRVIIHDIESFAILGFLFNKKRYIRSFNRIAYFAVQPYIFKEEYLSPVAKGLKQLVLSFLMYFGIPWVIAIKTAKVISTIFQHDNAYWMRLEDIFSETNKFLLLQNPRKEFARILGILIKREHQEGSDKRGLKNTYRKIQILLTIFFSFQR